MGRQEEAEEDEKEGGKGRVEERRIKWFLFRIDCPSNPEESFKLQIQFCQFWGGYNRGQSIRN